MDLDILNSVFLISYWTLCCYSTVLIPKIVPLIQCLFTRENEKCRSLRKQIKKLVAELNEISAVHDFAKHARKKRELSKLQDELKSSGANNSFNALKSTFILHALMYGILVITTYFVFRAFYAVPLFTFHSNWFYPLNYLMAMPDISVASNEGPVSSTFTLFLIWYLTRLTKLKR